MAQQVSPEEMARFLWAIGQEESGGRYLPQPNSAGAMGKYQVTPGLLQSYAHAALGHAESNAQYIASPSDQEKFAAYVLGDYVRKWGFSEAAGAWFAGPGGRNNLGASDGSTTVAKYRANVMALMGRAPQNLPPVGTAFQAGGGTASQPGTGNAQNANAQQALFGIPSPSELGKAIGSGISGGFMAVLHPIFNAVFWSFQVLGGAFLVMVAVAILAADSEGVQKIIGMGSRIASIGRA